MDEKKLDQLGFKKAASDLNKAKELKRKMTIAYEHFRYVRPEKFDAYDEKLKRNTLKEEGRQGSSEYFHNYDKLAFIPIAEYPNVPPQAVLDKIESAQEQKCFDRFEVCKVESIREYKDPIIFGVIEGCPDRFFISQWDTDVRIEDILNENEG